MTEQATNSGMGGEQNDYIRARIPVELKLRFIKDCGDRVPSKVLRSFIEAYCELTESGKRPESIRRVMGLKERRD